MELSHIFLYLAESSLLLVACWLCCLIKTTKKVARVEDGPTSARLPGTNNDADFWQESDLPSYSQVTQPPTYLEATKMTQKTLASPAEEEKQDGKEGKAGPPAAEVCCPPLANKRTLLDLTDME